MDSDKNWDWEDVLHLERSAYIEGVIAGENYQNNGTDSSDSEDEDESDVGEGYSFGFLKGLSIGLELGFMATAVQLGESDESNTTTTTTTTQRDFQRISKRRADLLKRIKSMPRTNNSIDGDSNNYNMGSDGGSSSGGGSGGGNSSSIDVDFESEIRSIRALFMQCSSPVGSLVNSAVKTDQQRDW